MKILSTFIIVLILLLLIAVATSGCAIYKTDEITGIGISRSLTINSGTFSDSEVIAHIYSESTQQNTLRALFDGFFKVLEKAIPKITMGK